MNRTFTQIIKERLNFRISEIFRRCYKLTSIQMTDAEYSQAYKYIYTEQNHFTPEDIEKIISNWALSLANISSIANSEYLKEIEKTLEINLDDNIELLDKKKLQEYYKLKIRLAEFRFLDDDINTKFDNERKAIEDSYNLRHGFLVKVFDGNTGKLTQFLKKKNKIASLTKEQFRKLDKYIEILNENKSFEDSISSTDFIDNLEHQYSEADKNRLIKKIESDRSNALKNYESYIIEIDTINNKINDILLSLEINTAFDITEYANEDQAHEHILELNNLKNTIKKTRKNTPNYHLLESKILEKIKTIRNLEKKIDNLPF